LHELLHQRAANTPSNRGLLRLVRALANCPSVAWIFILLLTLGSGCGSRKPSGSGGSPGIKGGEGAHSNRTPDTSSGIQFEDVAAKSGVEYRWPLQPRPQRNVEAFGAGCAFLDFDDDGWMDILLVANPHPLLFHNKGNGTFENVTSASGLDKLNGNWTGVAVGDYNGDARLDFILTGIHCLALLKNVDLHRFANATVEAGLDPSNHKHWGSGAAFMDLDGSGRLALIILNYVIFGPTEPQYCEFVPGVKTGCPPSKYKPEYCEVWQNLGNGRFKDVTVSSGFKNTHGKGLVVAFCDVDEDGKIDFYIGNDGTPADLMRNMGGLRFQNIGEQSGTATDETRHSLAAMGADWADFDRDGKLDLAVSAFSNEMYAVMHNLGNSLFEHVEDRVGIAGPTLTPLGFGTKWIDVDNDGWPDLMFANGHVYDKVNELDPAMTFRQPLMLFHNEPDKYEEKGRSFMDLVPSLKGDLAKPLLGRGMATGDIDNDGRVDVLVVDYEGPAVLLHNASQTGNHWITFDLRSSGANRFAYGAKVTARAGNAVWVAHVSPASSYLSSSDPRIHFGLGPVTSLDTVKVQWPDGKTDLYNNIAADHFVRITKGSTAPRILR
jgi:hypothetical protein